MAAESTFHINGQNILFTYPQCNADTGLLETWVLMKCMEIGEVGETIARQELHKDGNPHVHVGVRFNKRIDRKINISIFDYEGHHPNISTGGRGSTWAKVKAYVTKGDKDEEEDKKLAGIGFKSGEEYLAYWREKDPKKVWMRGVQFDIQARRLDKEAAAAICEEDPEPLTFDNVPEVMTKWVQEVLQGPPKDRYPCLVLLGESRTGKTTWARQLIERKYQAYSKSRFDFDSYTKDKKLWIIDDCDMTFDDGISKTVLNGTIGTITGKYRHEKRVHGMPCIWISNTAPEWLRTRYWREKGADGQPNAIFVNLTTPLWKEDVTMGSPQEQEEPPRPTGTSSMPWFHLPDFKDIVDAAEV